MKRWVRHLPAALSAVLIGAALWRGPIAQFPDYHYFADQRSVGGIPHFADVLSNLGFALIALWGACALPQVSGHDALKHGWAGYRLFLIGLFLTAFGSAYYHLAPDNARLVWDRLPIALACGGLLAGVWGDVKQRSSSLLAAGMAISGIYSVVWWHLTAQAGTEDLRPYLLLQILPMLLIPLWQLIHRAPKADCLSFSCALLLYAAAKVAEINDHRIAEAFGLLTGHNLKHLLATASAALIVARLIHRTKRCNCIKATYDKKTGRSVFKIILRLTLRLMFRLELRGDTSVFVNTRTLVVANHESFIDGLLLGLSMPVDAVYVVHKQIAEQPFFRFLLRFVRYLPVESTSPLALKQIVKLVETGQPVVIFPEGRITRTGSLMKVYDGAAFVAAKTGATVVPVRIDGAARSYFGRLAGIYPLKLFPKVTIAIQQRRSIPMPDLPSARERRRRAGELMRQILLDMLVASRPERTIYHAFLDGMATFGSHYELVEDIRLHEESYGSLLRMALGLQRVISRHTRPDEVVGVLTPSAAPTPAVILALSASRRIPAMLNYTAGSDGLRAACTAAAIKTVIVSRSFLEKARLTPIVEKIGGINLLYLEDLKIQITPQDKLWVLWHLMFPRLAAHPQAPHDPAVVLFTSGSEGKPKGVVHSHSSVLANVAQIRAVADFTPLDKFMMALPLFHSFGLTCGVLLPLVSGCKVFLYPNPLHYRVIPELVYDRNCTVLFGTSTFLGNYARYAHPYDFGRLRYVVAGAEKLSAEVHDTWMEKFGIRILEGYGVTECAPVVAVNVPMACKTGSVGQLLPCIEHQLEPVPGIEKGGALHVKGPNVMKGYYLFDSPGAIQKPAAISDGWYATGDIVEIDAEGFVHIRGRIKRFAKIAGEMISLEVVEGLAREASPGHVHAASTRPDASKGEALVLFTTDRDLKREMLLAAARAAGAPELAVPRLIRTLKEIPLLGTGKTDYVTLKHMAEEPAGKDAVDEDEAAVA